MSAGSMPLILFLVHGLAEKSGAYINTKLSSNAIINLLRITLIILGTSLIITSIFIAHSF